MDNIQVEEFEKELLSLMAKYGLESGAFVATDEDDHMIGIHHLQNGGKTMASFARSIENEARLYQSGRERMMQILDKMAETK